MPCVITVHVASCSNTSTHVSIQHSASKFHCLPRLPKSFRIVILDISPLFPFNYTLIVPFYRSPSNRDGPFPPGLGLVLQPQHWANSAGGQGATCAIEEPEKLVFCDHRTERGVRHISRRCVWWWLGKRVGATGTGTNAMQNRMHPKQASQSTMTTNFARGLAACQESRWWAKTRRAEQ